MQRRTLWQWMVVSLVGGTIVGSVTAGEPGYQTEFMQWRSQSGHFQNWSHQGTRLTTEGTIQLDPDQAQREQDPFQAGDYHGGNYYTGGEYWVGETIGPVMPAAFGFQGALPSWNGETPPGTWLETQIRLQSRGEWTRWYSLGVWASDDSTVQRHSVTDQDNADGSVYVDLVVLKDKPMGGEAYQVKVRLFSNSLDVSPSLRSLAVALSTVPERPTDLQPGNPETWGQILDLPQCSQMVYPDGGEVWCSPTSVSMVLGYWQQDQRSCEPQIRSTVQGVFDWLYDGHGNWPFNTAYAASQGLESVVARLTSLAQAEAWIEAGVPVVFSFAWEEGDLEGAAIPRSDGHLAVLVGFDAKGDPVVHDPAAASDQDVKRTYDRTQLETLWLEHTGGTVYLIYPPNWSIPSLS